MVARWKEALAIPTIRLQGLKQYQINGAQFMLSAKRCINSGPTGSGKSVMTLAAVDAANLYPLIIVCPAQAKLKWAGEVRYWLPGRTVSVLKGRKKQYDGYVKTFAKNRIEDIPINDLSADIIIVNYQIAWDWAARLDKGFKAITIDESHFVKDSKTKQSKAVKYIAEALELVNGTRYKFMLTATPTVNRPADLINQLDILGRLSEFGGWYGFTNRYCALTTKTIKVHGKLRTFKDYSGSSNEAELNQMLTSFLMFRLTKADTLPELDPINRDVIPVDLSNWADYKRAEADFLLVVRETAANDQKARQRIKKLSFLELRKLMPDTFDQRYGELSEAEKISVMHEILIGEHIRSAERRARKTQGLSKLGILRKLVGIGKVKAVTEWINEATQISPDDKRLIFAHHISVQEELASNFPEAAVIKGGQNDNDREFNKNRFQTDPKCNNLVASMTSAQDSIDLDAAYTVLSVEIPNTYKALTQCEGRAYGRQSNPHSINSYLFVAPGTVDDPSIERLNNKKSMSEKIEDGVETEKIAAADIETELFEWFVEKETV